MTETVINQNDGFVSITAVGGETSLDFDFPIYEKSHLRIIRTRASVDIDLVLDTDYTIADDQLEITAGGEAVLAGSSTPAVAGDIYTLLLDVPEERTGDFNQGGDFFAATLNRELDLLVQIAQQLRRDVNKSIRVSDTSTLNDLSIPDGEANKVIGWNASGDALENKTPNTGAYLSVSAFMETVLDDTTAAAARATLGAAVSGANNDITSLSGITSINGAAFSGFRDKVINGAHRVNKAGNVAIVNNAVTYGGPDMFFGNPQSFTTASGNLTQYSGVATSSSYAYGASMTTTGSGDLFYGTRLEAKDTISLNSQTYTYSFIAYQNTGSAVNVYPAIYKANAADDFSATTLLATGSVVSVPSGTPTLVTQTITFGSSDASNGLQLSQKFASVGAVTGKDFWIGDVQLTPGSVVTTKEQRPIEVEYALCERYLPAFIGSGTTDDVSDGWCPSTSTGYGRFNFVVTPRVPPTGITVSSAGHFNYTQTNGTTSVVTALVFVRASTKLATMQATGTGTPYTADAKGYLQAISASAKILFTGCQL